MNMRWIIALGALLLIGAITVTGIGLAQAGGINGGFGPQASQGSPQNPTNQPGPYGPGGMWGPGGGMGPGGMMGPGGWMGGYQNGQNQNPADVAPVSGNTVAIQNFAYQPANLQVKAGTTVTWTNNDTAPHSITFRDSALKSSGILRQGDTYSYTFTEAGTFTYYCNLHPYMTAQVIVTK